MHWNLVKHRPSALATVALGLFVCSVIPSFSRAGDAGRETGKETVSNDPISRLSQTLDSGKSSLQYDPLHGYLPSLLQQLKIPASSQTLVFSKTSFQRDRISPAHPRALYFND